MGVQLHHGDCLEVMPGIPDASVDMVLCDLPYGTTACKWDVAIPFAPLWEQYRRVVKRNGAIVLFGTQPFISALVMSNPAMFRCEWIWRKNYAAGFLNARRQPMRNHESVLVFSDRPTIYYPIKQRSMSEQRIKRALKGDQMRRTIPRNDRHVYQAKPITGPFQEFVYPTTVQEFDCVPRIEMEHPTQKPVALCEYLIRTYTNEGEVVLDNTMGSGTTGVACVNTGRAFVGIEKDAGYYAIAERRIQEAQQAARQLTLEGVA